MSRYNLEIVVPKYTGTGAARRIDLTGLPPIFAAIKSSGLEMSCCTPHMRGRAAYWGTSSTERTDQMTQMGPGGIVLGTNSHVNAAATTYYGLIIASTAQTAAITGRYRGTGSVGSIRNGHFPFKPDVCFSRCSADGLTQAVMRTASMTDANSTFLSNGGTFNSLITGFLDDGISVGTLVGVNNASYTYDYLALKHVSGAIMSGRYTGTGSARDVSGVGFSPDFLLIKEWNATTETHALVVTKDMITDGLTGMKIGAHANEADAVTAIGTDGFTLGAAAAVNESGKLYDYVAFKAGQFNVPPTRTAV